MDASADAEQVTGRRVVVAESEDGSLAVLMQSEDELAARLERRRQRIFAEAAQVGSTWA